MFIEIDDHGGYKRIVSCLHIVGIVAGSNGGTEIRVTGDRGYIAQDSYNEVKAKLSKAVPGFAFDDDEKS